MNYGLKENKDLTDLWLWSAHGATVAFVSQRSGDTAPQFYIKDYRVPVNHGIELYQALLQNGVPARLLYFNDENHWVLKAGNSLVWYREVKGWLDKYAGPSAAQPVSGSG